MLHRPGGWFLLSALTLAGLWASAQQAWVWPLSNSTTADAMNTSFGPRINNAMWDFHDGIDLPAPFGTPAFAVAGGTVYREGAGGTDGISSRHVVLQIPGAGGTPFASPSPSPSPESVPERGLRTLSAKPAPCRHVTNFAKELQSFFGRRQTIDGYTGSHCGRGLDALR